MGNFHIESVVWDSIFNPVSDIRLEIRYAGAAFRICYQASALAASPSALEQHRESYRILYKDDPDGESHETVERLWKPFEKLMVQMAPHSTMEVLHRHLYPPWFVLQARADESGCIQPDFKEALSRQEIKRPGEYVNDFLRPHLSPLLDSKLNTYSSRQVQVLDQTSRLVPSRVSVNGTVYFFKPWISGREHGYHELLSYRKIMADADASPPLLTDVRICRLHGLVIDSDDDVLRHYPLNHGEKNYSGIRLVGLLLTYIENRGTLKDLAPWSDCTNEDRFRWSRQIRHLVQCLHAAGVVWGDVKPGNVLVTGEGDACIVDFGGSYTQGWVDEDKRETVEGDWQGVQRIDDWLIKWSRKPVTRIKRK